MNSTLFSMHNIKYIVSVDDCYFAPKRNEIKAELYSEMCDSIEPFKEHLISIGKSDQLSEIDDLSSLGTDVTSLINDLLDGLADSELSELLVMAGKIKVLNSEQAGILAFLAGLKKQGCIEEYFTVSSTVDATALNYNDVGMKDGNILWLLDRNFERVGESAEAGIQLAQTIVQRKTDQVNYVYILSAVEQDSDKSEDDIETEFDRLLSTDCDPLTSSFIYYINKQRILLNKEARIEKSLAQGFKRKVCYELFQTYGDCLSESFAKSSEIIFGIKQQTLNYLFSKKISEKGESHVDFITRLVQILQTEEYNKALSTNHETIAKKIAYYDSLCSAVADVPGDVSKITPILNTLRDIELFNKHINSQHFEVSTGDIFFIKGSYYLLVSQTCDTYLRKTGCRKLDSASLLRIDENSTAKFKYELSCFMTLQKPAVIYQSQLIIPFDILDLCVLNYDGQASLDLDYIQDGREIGHIGYTKNYIERYRKICTHLKGLYDSRSVLEQYIDNNSVISSEGARTAYEILLNEDAFLKNYNIQNGKLCYPVQRVCRLDELTTIDIVKEYGVTLSRIGHPFDFTE